MYFKFPSVINNSEIIISDQVEAKATPPTFLFPHTKNPSESPNTLHPDPSACHLFVCLCVVCMWLGRACVYFCAPVWFICNQWQKIDAVCAAGASARAPSPGRDGAEWACTKAGSQNGARRKKENGNTYVSEHVRAARWRRSRRRTRPHLNQRVKNG